MVLVGYTSSSVKGFLVEMHAAAHTHRLSYLIAHRPASMAPLCSPHLGWQRKRHLTSGRVALHVITGKVMLNRKAMAISR